MALLCERILQKMMPKIVPFLSIVSSKVNAHCHWTFQPGIIKKEKLKSVVCPTSTHVHRHRQKWSIKTSRYPFQAKYENAF